MIYKIKAIRSKDIPWSGGTFRKYEVKTEQTGEEVLELRLGEKRNAKIQAGMDVEGYIENSSYKGKNGVVQTKILKPITAEYVYKLLLKLAPHIESLEPEASAPQVAKDEWSNQAEPTEPDTTEPGF